MTYFVLGALVSWFFTRLYYKQASKDLKTQYQRALDRQKWFKTEDYFYFMLTSGDWEFREIDMHRSWICKQDRALSIQEENDSEEFGPEGWFERLPYQTSRAYFVLLKSQGDTFNKLRFVAFDGSRMVIPLPRAVKASEATASDPMYYYYWDASSIECKVSNIIGKFDSFQSLAEVARRFKLEYVTAQMHT